MKKTNHSQAKRRLIPVVALTAATLLLLSFGLRQTLTGTLWQATEREETTGGVLVTALEFQSDSTGLYSLLSIDGNTDVHHDFPFSYTYDASTRQGRVYLADDNNVYPFSLNDTALIFPGIRWAPVAYTQVRR